MGALLTNRAEAHACDGSISLKLAQLLVVGVEGELHLLVGSVEQQRLAQEGEQDPRVLGVSRERKLGLLRP